MTDLCTEPTDIDPSQLTHILYAFADVSPTTGDVFLTDKYADEEVCLGPQPLVGTRRPWLTVAPERNTFPATLGARKGTTCMAV